MDAIDKELSKHIVKHLHDRLSTSDGSQKAVQEILTQTMVTLADCLGVTGATAFSRNPDSWPVALLALIGVAEASFIEHRGTIAETQIKRIMTAKEKS